MVTAGNSARRASKSFLGALGSKAGLGDVPLVETPWTVNWVCASARRENLMSTRRLKWHRKSAPSMGFLTSAMTKT